MGTHGWRHTSSNIIDIPENMTVDHKPHGAHTHSNFQANYLLDRMIALSNDLAEDMRRKKASTSCDEKLGKLQLESNRLNLNLKMLDPEMQMELVQDDEWRSTAVNFARASREHFCRGLHLCAWRAL